MSGADAGLAGRSARDGEQATEVTADEDTAAAGEFSCVEMTLEGIGKNERMESAMQRAMVIVWRDCLTLHCLTR